MAQCQRRRGKDVGWRRRITPAGEDVEHDIGGMDAMGNCLGAGRLDGWQAVSQNRVEDVDHLPIAIVGTGELAPHTFYRSGQHQSLKGAPLPKAPGLRASTGT